MSNDGSSHLYHCCFHCDCLAKDLGRNFLSWYSDLILADIFLKNHVKHFSYYALGRLRMSSHNPKVRGGRYPQIESSGNQDCTSPDEFEDLHMHIATRSGLFEHHTNLGSDGEHFGIVCTDYRKHAIARSKSLNFGHKAAILHSIGLD